MLSKYGAPTLLSRVLSRPGVIIGAVLFCALLAFLPSRIWDIRVSGNNIIDTQVILQLLSELGLKNGSDISSLNLKSTGEKLRIVCPDLASVAISHKGSVCLVKVTERTVADKVQHTQWGNLIAARDGIISMVICTSGHSAVKTGDIVTKGQLLISGIFEDYYGESTFTRAAGQVCAVTQHEVSFTIPRYTVKTGDSAEKHTRIGLDIFGFYLPLYLMPNTPMTVTTDYRPLQIGNITFPLGIYLHELSPADMARTQKSSAQIKSETDILAAKYAKEQQITNYSVEITSTSLLEDSILISAVISGTENIAVYQKLSLQ